jgi:lipid-binding SYLF domain-containing protein
MLLPGPSRITVEQAREAARVVYRDRATGKMIVLGHGEKRPSRARPRVSKASSDKR